MALQSVKTSGIIGCPLALLCDHGAVWHNLAKCGASVPMKLSRCGVLATTDAEAIAVAVAPEEGEVLRGAAAAMSNAANLPLEWNRRLDVPEEDDPDELLIAVRRAKVQSPSVPRLLGQDGTQGLLNDLLLKAAARNLRRTASLLVAEGADVRTTVEVRRPMRGREGDKVTLKSVVDVAARAAGLDGDWGCVIDLVGHGAHPRFPLGVFFSILRQGAAAHASGSRSNSDQVWASAHLENELALVQKMIDLGVTLAEQDSVTLLCDVCAHGYTSQARFLVDELKVPVNGRNIDGDSCTDRALAWHCWETVQWLIKEKGGRPLKPGSAVAHLLDARDNESAVTALHALLGRGLIDYTEVLRQAVIRGDSKTCDILLESLEEGEATEFLRRPLRASMRGRTPETIVDLAIGEGHLRIARLLIEHGGRPFDIRKALQEAETYLSGPSGIASSLAEELEKLLMRRRSDTL